MTTNDTASRAPGTAAGASTDRLFSILVGLTTLAVFLQTVWAGMMIREGKDYDASWVSVHDWGARVAFVLALAAVVVALLRLRSRRDLLVGAVALAVLIFAESYVGGLVGDKPGIVALHIPLGTAILSLAVWLPFRSTRTR